jgi:HEAT repeat protein
MWSISRRWPCAFCCCLLLTGCTRDPAGNIVARLSNPDVEARRSSARALSEDPCSDERVIAALAKNIGDSDVDVRFLSIAALGKLGPLAKSVSPALKPALADSEKRVRLEAAIALERIDPQDGASRPVLTAAMQEGDGRTLLAIGALGADAAWAVPTLTGLLSHSSPQTRALAARTLGRIGPAANGAKAALDAASRDKNPAVQKAASDALSRIAAKSAQ